MNDAKTMHLHRSHEYSGQLTTGVRDALDFVLARGRTRTLDYMIKSGMERAGAETRLRKAAATGLIEGPNGVGLRATWETSGRARAEEALRSAALTFGRGGEPGELLKAAQIYAREVRDGSD